MTSILPFLLLFSLITLSLASGLPSGRSNKEVTTMYEKWLVKHQKVYNGLGEKEQRFKIFKDNLKFIDEHNAQNHTYTLGLNQFADMTNEEYNMYLGTRINDDIKNKTISQQYGYNSGYKLAPVSVDWRSAVGPIKHQGSCSSCWAFTAVTTVEAINKIVTGSFVNLSVQELVDCDRTYSKGCKGGYYDRAYEFIIKNGGIDTEEDYPYKESDGTCDQGKKNTKVVSINSFKKVLRDNERELMNVVAKQPVSVTIDAFNNGIKFYKSGVFTGRCESERKKLNHAVVIVGYGSENGVDYWLLRNTWGTNWGEDGYFKLERNLKNTRRGKCGIAMYPSYPVKNGPNSAYEKTQVLVSSA